MNFDRRKIKYKILDNVVIATCIIPHKYFVGEVQILLYPLSNKTYLPSK